MSHTDSERLVKASPGCAHSFVPGVRTEHAARCSDCDDNPGPDGCLVETAAGGIQLLHQLV